MSSHWNSFDIQQRVNVRNYLLTYIANNALGLPPHVINALIQGACRITSLGWFDDVAQREIVDEVKKFLAATVSYAIVGLQIFITQLQRTKDVLGLDLVSIAEVC